MLVGKEDINTAIVFLVISPGHMLLKIFNIHTPNVCSTNYLMNIHRIISTPLHYKNAQYIPYSIHYYLLPLIILLDRSIGSSSAMPFVKHSQHESTSLHEVNALITCYIIIPLSAIISTIQCIIHALNVCIALHNSIVEAYTMQLRLGNNVLIISLVTWPPPSKKESYINDRLPDSTASPLSIGLGK